MFLAYDIALKHKKPFSYPRSVIINLANYCQYQCPICSINSLEAKKTNRVINKITFKEIVGYERLFRRTRKVAFLGFLGESILNPDFDLIVKYLKKNGISLYMTTKASGITPEKQKLLLDSKFDRLSISLHAFNESSYTKLLGKDYKLSFERLQDLMKQKNDGKHIKPEVTVEYALNKENIAETADMIKFLNDNKVNHMHLTHYHDYVKNKGIAFESADYDDVNKQIDRIYEYANANGYDYLLPNKKPYFHDAQATDFENTASETEKKCYLPWMGIQFRSSYSHKDSYYVGCCNVFNVFLFNYKEHIKEYGEIKFKQIWHHPIFQYLRQTVNSANGKQRNPLCAYCKSNKRIFFKNTDNRVNYLEKQKAIEGFFEAYKKENSISSNEFVDDDILKVLYSEDDELKAMADI